MVVLIVHEDRVLAFKRKREPPITANTYGPMTLKAAVKRVQLVARSIHISRTACRIQRSEQISESSCLRRLNSCLRSGFGKPPQSFVPITPNHAYSV
jgi:hypothetical protein